MPTNDTLAFFLNKEYNYFTVSFTVFAAGASVGADTSISFNVLFNSGALEALPLGIAKFANKIKANIAIANVQVALSKKVFVL